MTDAYTYIPKPTGTPYIQIGFQGKQMYDDSTIRFDDSITFYDSTNLSAYTNIPKPTTGNVRQTGKTIGLLIPLTVPSGQFINLDSYTRISKPTS